MCSWHITLLRSILQPVAQYEGSMQSVLRTVTALHVAGMTLMQGIQRGMPP